MTPQFAKRSHYQIYFSLSIIVTLLGSFLYYIDSTPFIRFLGNLNPLIALIISIITGLLLLKYLMFKTNFAIYRRNNLKNYLILIGIAFLFGIEVIVADIWFVEYPSDINVPLPKSLLFYPTIGYVVEVFFHLLPLSIIIFILSKFRNLSMSKIIWISIISVSILEPFYQIWFTSQNSLITTIYTGIHVFLFSLTQLLIFKHFDFISMFLFRIVFYSIWHIFWGHLRLELLF